MGQHQIVVGGDVLGVDGQHFLVGGDGRVVLPVEELQASDLAEHHAVARVLRARRRQVFQRFVVAAEGAQRRAEKEMRAREVGREGQRALEQRDRGFHFALLQQDPRRVHRPVGIVGVDGRHPAEGRLGPAQVALQQQADAVVVPALPQARAAAGRGGRRREQRRVGVDDRQGRLGFRHHRRGDVGNRLHLPRHVARVAGEHPPPVVVAARDRRGRVRRVALAGERPLREPPGELAVVDPGPQGDAVARVFGHLQPVVDGVGRAGGDQPHVGDRAGGPGVALVDGVAVFVELQAAVEVRAGVHRPAAAVGRRAAVQQHAAPVVHGLELDPDVEGVDRPAGEEVTDVAGAHHHLDAHRFAAPHGRRRQVEGRNHLRRFRPAGQAPPRPELQRLFADRERARQRGLGPRRARRRRGRRFGRAGDAEHVYRHLPGPQEVLHGLELLGVAVHERQGRVGAGEAVRPHEAVARGRVVGPHQGHVARAARLRRLGVVERPRTLSRHPRRLPVVVLVEPAHPAVVVDRHVEVHLVARRAELGALLAVERLDERVAVGLGGEPQQQVVHVPQQRVAAGREVVQRGVLDGEVSLTHRAADAHDRVARRAAEPRLGLGRVDLLDDGPVEAPVEEDRVVVAAGAPLRRRGAHDFLHVLDGASVPLVVERREAVGRAGPLVVDVGVAASAGLAGEEEVGGNDVAGVRGGRRRRERAGRAGPLLGHARGGAHGVLDAVGLAPFGVPRRAQQGGAQPGRDGRDEADADGLRPPAVPGGRAPQVDAPQRRAGRGRRHVHLQQPGVVAAGPDGRHRQPQGQPRREQSQPRRSRDVRAPTRPARVQVARLGLGCRRVPAPPPPPHRPHEGPGQRQPQQGVQAHHGEVAQGRGGRGDQQGRGQHQGDEAERRRRGSARHVSFYRQGDGRNAAGPDALVASHRNAGPAPCGERSGAVL